MVKSVFVLVISIVVFSGCWLFPSRVVYPQIHIPYHHFVPLDFEVTYMTAPIECDEMQSILRTHDRKVVITDRADFEEIESGLDNAIGTIGSWKMIIDKHNKDIGKIQ